MWAYLVNDDATDNNWTDKITCYAGQLIIQADAEAICLKADDRGPMNLLITDFYGNVILLEFIGDMQHNQSYVSDMPVSDLIKTFERGPLDNTIEQMEQAGTPMLQIAAIGCVGTMVAFTAWLCTLFFW